MMRVAVDFDWKKVGPLRLSTAGRLAIPQVPAASGIYRFQVLSEAGPEVYIGESRDLRQRMVHNYASTHTGATNVRVRDMLLRHLTAGRDVRLAIVTEAVLIIEDELTAADLHLKEVRRLIESAALVLARQAGERIHDL
jgi:hypothetical protein